MGKLINLGAIEDKKFVLQKEHLDRSYIFDKTVGAIKYGQVVSFDSTTGKCVKYDKVNAKEIFTIYVGDSLVSPSDKDFVAPVLSKGARVDKKYLIGIDEDDFEGLHKLYLAGIILEEVN